MAGDGNDDRISVQCEQLSVLFPGAAGDQLFGRACDGKTMSLEMAVKRKIRMFGGGPVKTDCSEQFRRKNGAVSRNGLSVHEPQPVHQHQFGIGWVRQPFYPGGPLECEEAVR